MRKYAYLKQPQKDDAGGLVYKIMLYEAEDGVYLFGYGSPDAVRCSWDLFYHVSVEDSRLCRRRDECGVGLRDLATELREYPDD